MDFRRLEHFLAIVEQGGVTAAAEHLHLTQQALSASLGQFERQLGTPLFDRAGRGLVLTDAGRAVADRGPGVVAAARDTVAVAREAGRGERMPLRVGRSPAVSSERLAGLIGPMADDGTQTDTPIEVVQSFPGQLYDDLLAGRIDVAFARGHPRLSGTGWRTVAFDRLRVAVDAVANPWASRSGVAITELAGSTIAVWGRSGHSAYTDFLAGICIAAGFEPRLRRTERQGMPPVAAAAGMDVAFVTDPAGPADGGRAQVIDLDPPVYAPLDAVWVGPTPVPRLAELLDACDRAVT